MIKKKKTKKKKVAFAYQKLVICQKHFSRIFCSEPTFVEQEERDGDVTTILRKSSKVNSCSIFEEFKKSSLTNFEITFHFFLRFVFVSECDVSATHIYCNNITQHKEKF